MISPERRWFSHHRYACRQKRRFLSTTYTIDQLVPGKPKVQVSTSYSCANCLFLLTFSNQITLFIGYWSTALIFRCPAPQNTNPTPDQIGAWWCCALPQCSHAPQWFVLSASAGRVQRTIHWKKHAGNNETPEVTQLAIAQWFGNGYSEVGEKRIQHGSGWCMPGRWHTATRRRIGQLILPDFRLLIRSIRTNHAHQCYLVNDHKKSADNGIFRC